MADEKKEALEQAAAGRTPLSVKFSVFMLLVTACVFLPTTILLTVCMLPTLVAVIVDVNPRRTMGLTVGAMNLAGSVPVWFTLLDRGHTLAAALQLVMEPSSIIISFSGAAVGTGIHYYVTPLIASVMQSKSERRLREIDKRQKALVHKWGEGVILK